MLGDLCKDKVVLDLGSAHWVEKTLLKQLGAKSITKVDIAPTPDDGDTLKADACDTKLLDNSYDVIICRELIEHLTNPDKLLSEMYRMLKEGGYLFIATPNAYSIPPDGINHLRGYTPQGFVETIERHFKIIDRRGNIPYVFSTLLPAFENGLTFVLREFKDLALRMETMTDSYYFGTNLFVLCVKK